MSDRFTRVSVVSSDRCKPKKCRHDYVALLSKHENMAWKFHQARNCFYFVGALYRLGICVKRCPWEAVQIINLPKDLDKVTTPRYGASTFKLHRLPVPRPRQILGLVGINGISKSTALKVLAGKLKPNLGRLDSPPDWHQILIYFRGSELQVLDRDVGDLSGGELQRFGIAAVAMQHAEIYMFDELSSHLDVKQRLRAAQVVRSLLKPVTSVIVVEHDLSVLDYLSDFICCLYEPDKVSGSETEVPEFNVSFKPQKINLKSESNVYQLLHQRIGDSYTHPQYNTDFMKPLEIEALMDQEVLNLSGDERVALYLCLGQPVDIYLIDEPSAFLDSAQRIIAEVIRRCILHTKKTAFVVEHDFTMATYLADRVIVYEGSP
ncbi:hypothetical protein R1flu_001342 [Riccia fluitans]|uniref:ABC transporter domain-containing protein n=1 Tax=Riccia fluitans TaxID=41844 RepID=A0ABD1Y689_9MARC